jgi:hypothetical protein
MWPLHAVLDHEALVHHALGDLAAESLTPRLELRASEIARRRTEEKRAEAFFPLRATTTAADPKRDARAAQD